MPGNNPSPTGRPNVSRVRQSQLITARDQNSIIDSHNSFVSGLGRGEITTRNGKVRRVMFVDESTPSIPSKKIIALIWRATGAGISTYKWRYSFKQQKIIDTGQGLIPVFSDDEAGVTGYAWNLLEIRNGGRGSVLSGGVNTGGASYPETWFPQPIGGGSLIYDGGSPGLGIGGFSPFIVELSVVDSSEFGTFYFFQIGNQSDGVCP